jgi:glycosyltransferase involved in cell wall biosynthesis
VTKRTMNETAHDSLYTEIPRSERYDLAIVVPVYNEADCIATVVRDWRATLEGIGSRFVMIVVDDGSTDATASVLQSLSDEPRIRVVRQANQGHGPTILHGYRLAVAQAPWVFQCDSDDEMSPESFPKLWALRDPFDAVFGYRVQRRQSAARWFISVCSRITVRCLFGRGLRDVNTPYRLLRTTALRPILENIAPDTFAPNVIITGLLALGGARICQIAVPHQHRRTGRVSLLRWRLWRSAWRSFVETVRCRRAVSPGWLEQPHHLAPETEKCPQRQGNIGIRAVPSGHGAPDELQGSRSPS